MHDAQAVIRLDTRGLHPPEPMIRILEAVERLEGAGQIEALLDRRPLFLFPELEARGLAYTCEPTAGAPGFTVTVRREAR